MTETAQESPLLRLPAELRNQIYDCVLQSNPFSLMRIEKDEDNKVHRIEIPFNHEAFHHLSILRVCRQTHREMAGMPCRLNIRSLEVGVSLII